MHNSLTKPFRANSFMDRLYPKQYAMGHHGNAFTSFGGVPNQAIWGQDADQVIENYTTYTSQANANAKWVPNVDAANQRVDLVNDNLKFTAVKDSTSDENFFDLGAGTISETDFTLDFKLTTLSSTLGGSSIALYLFLTDTQGKIIGTNRDGFGLFMINDGTDRTWRVSNSDGVNFGSGTNETDFTTDWVNSTDYFFRFSRSGTTAGNISFFPTSARTTPTATQNTTLASSIDGLRYLYVMNNDFNTLTGDIPITIDDVTITAL